MPEVKLKISKVDSVRKIHFLAHSIKLPKGFRLIVYFQCCIFLPKLLSDLPFFPEYMLDFCCAIKELKAKFIL